MQALEEVYRKRMNHELSEYIDGSNPQRPIIDFDMSTTEVHTSGLKEDEF